MRRVTAFLKSVPSRLSRAFRALLSPDPGGRIVFFCRLPGKTILIEGVTRMIITATQEVDLAIKPLDARGNPAQVDGRPEWESSDPSVIEVLPATDGLSCVARAKGKLGHALISVTADADLGAGVQNITGTIDIDIAASQAISIEIIAGEMREQG
jgi:hypothetical protein